MDWARILASVTGTVDQELLFRNEYLAAENWIPKALLKTPLRLTYFRSPRKQLPALVKAVEFPEVGGLHHRYERLAA